MTEAPGDIHYFDWILKKTHSILDEIRLNNPHSVHLSQHELSEFLDYIQLKYVENFTSKSEQRTVLAEIIYRKVQREGMEFLYGALNKQQGVALVLNNSKVLLQKIRGGPMRGVWYLPAGFVNSNKGDRSTEDVAKRMLLSVFGNVPIVSCKLLDIPIDTIEYALRLGRLPDITKVYEISTSSHKIIDSSAFYSIEEILSLNEGIHPLLAQILVPYTSHPREVKRLNLLGEKTINRITHNTNFHLETDFFNKERAVKRL